MDFHFILGEGGKMQNLPDSQRDVSALIDTVGGEPFVGSGFETEASEAGFSAAEFEEAA
jgi:hypothetical protein